MTAAMDCTVAQAAEFSLVARRNNSLDSSARLLAFLLILAAPAGIAAAFALSGAWPILPFAGLEALGLFLAFRHVERHAADYERVTIEGDRVKVEISEGGVVRRHEFNRCWVQVVADGAGQGRLALRSHGREIEFGRHLDAAGRVRAARELRRRLRA
jgi:uncharacterized membrane protein